MENASKALLIAGSILLFVLLSTFAAYIFARTRSQTTEIYDLMTSSQVDNFNQKFLKYEDKKLKIQDVVSIINIAKNNNKRGNMPTEIKVTADSGIFEGTSETDLLKESININKLLYYNLDKDKIYTCELEYGSNSNLIKEIKIHKGT